MLTQVEIVRSTKELDEICPIHKVHILQLDKVVKIAGENEPRKPSPFCPECVKEQRKKKEQEELEKLLNVGIYQKTYNVLMRDSTIPKELKEATFNNFKTETPEEKQLLAFAKNQVKKYLEGMRGNTLFTGSTGIGKSHLSVAMAKALNESYKAKGTPKSVLFVNLTEIIKQIKEGWNYGKGARLTEFEAVERLKSVDFLILDDLGAKNVTVSSKSDWEQDLLFDVLNGRENTIINTNLNATELKTVYNERNYSRILKGLEGNSFKSFTIKDKRYSINNLKGKATQN
ncbi:ATP-binding protein [Streptococcus pyogenes]|uniref:ATP-binding protein n=1 Tax=Streptococcus pyogenes TaxID=1314 RepID=UPI0010A14BFF|nr:ATP-binding protein [Streptococcus pyogenes]QBX10614.1 helicase loader [Streptococcus satellite phage Javan462]VGX17395.1 zinc finger protein [Streptococcus pyogenes]VGY21085.1 zinc finger protein [Streptococcus pyogenes]VGY23881.1 zinc finger protein [Streptococcus pyogenes]VGY65775.1 zinc finger protein [Streptococcus pyogenes]